MVQIRKRILIGFAAAALAAGASSGPRFLADDPIWAWPAPVPINSAKSRNINALYDFIINSVAPPGVPKKGPIPPAQAINTLGEVPDSAWFTNRHGMRRMSIEELRKGPTRGNEPVGPWEVQGAKTEGVTPGFTVKDARGHRYLVKTDPLDNPEMASGADVVGSHFFYAFGYNTPENYIMNFRADQLRLSPKATISTVNGRKRPMRQEDLERILDRVPKNADGTYRGMASFFIAGQLLGPYRYEGTRADDPNDIIPHQDRRDLRGLYVFCSWMNHTDAKSINSLDSLVDENGVKFVRHYLIDFGAILGSDSDEPKDPSFGHAYIIPRNRKRIPVDIVSLGLNTPSWEHAHYLDIPAVGRFEAAKFVPDEWKSNYPNPAFLNHLPDDAFWAAKIVMAFTREEIRTMVETGQYSDPRATDYLTGTLIERQQKIGRYYFEQVLPLDRFRVENGELAFDDLAVKYGFTPRRSFDVRWFRFDNASNQRAPMSASGVRIPAEAESAAPGSYWGAEIKSGNNEKLVRAYLRKEAAGWKVVGIDRAW